MARILADNNGNAAGTILRLAWQQGLLREEITGLTWDQVDFHGGMLRLPGREVPMTAEVQDYLETLRQTSGESDHVVVSERFHQPMQPEAVSRIARRLLDQAGQNSVRLVDLRHDYIIRQLAEHDCGYVSRITGVEIRSLQLHFADYIAAGAGRAKKDRQETRIDEFRLWKILQAEQDSPAGLALWLTWQMGLQGGEIIALTWDQVDLGANVIRLPDREVPLTSTLSRMLEEQREKRGGEGHVLVSERAKNPMDIARLSRMARAALIRGGMENLTLKDLQRDALRLQEERLLLEEVRRRGSITRREVSALLGILPGAAYLRLRRMTEEKKLVLVGAKYYLAGDVVPPEEHETVIREYLFREGFAYRQDIARLLRVDERQCSLILKHLVEAGTLCREGQRYSLHREETAKEA